MTRNVKGTRVFVGLSGGVDSAVSAALLTRAGAKVTGVFIKGWYPPGMPCTWATDRRDAMRVAAHLGIPFRTLEAGADYKKSVIDYLLAEYKAGRTPNPDVMCNRDIKFGVFYRYAKQEGADFIATGHYIDGEKDQSYFLWAVPKSVLAETIFPLQGWRKDEVRRTARRLGLPVALKKDSQGICFLGQVSVKDFLSKELGDNPAVLHTLGERVDGRYVVEKNLEDGTLTLSNEQVSLSRPIRYERANWQDDPASVTHAQFRYRSAFIPGKITDNTFFPKNEVSDIATPGQSLVFYNKDKLVGGGIIAG